jgi:hypothetical protein
VEGLNDRLNVVAKSIGHGSCGAYTECRDDEQEEEQGSRLHGGATIAAEQSGNRSKKSNRVQ